MKLYKVMIFLSFSIFLLAGGNNELQAQENNIFDYQSVLPEELKILSGQIDSIYCTVYLDKGNYDIELESITTYKFLTGDIILKTYENDVKYNMEIYNNYKLINGKYVISGLLINQDSSIVDMEEHYIIQDKNNIISVTTFKNLNKPNDTLYIEENKDVSISRIKDKSGKYIILEKRIYDKRGNVIKSLSYEEDGGIVHESEMEYDDNDLVIKTISSGKGLGYFFSTYSYKIDNRGNWIQCIEKKDDYNRRITTREIFYK